MAIEIRVEGQADADAVRQVNEVAFGREGLARCRAAGYADLVVVGHPGTTLDSVSSPRTRGDCGTNIRFQPMRSWSSSSCLAGSTARAAW